MYVCALTDLPWTLPISRKNSNITTECYFCSARSIQLTLNLRWINGENQNRPEREKYHEFGIGGTILGIFIPEVINKYTGSYTPVYTCFKYILYTYLARMHAQATWALLQKRIKMGTASKNVYLIWCIMWFLIHYYRKPRHSSISNKKYRFSSFLLLLSPLRGESDWRVKFKLTIHHNL